MVMRKRVFTAGTSDRPLDDGDVLRGDGLRFCWAQFLGNPRTFGLQLLQRAFAIGVEVALYPNPSGGHAFLQRDVAVSAGRGLAGGACDIDWRHALLLFMNARRRGIEALLAMLFPNIRDPPFSKISRDAALFDYRPEPSQ
jgi:hypothetical protein